MQRMMGLSGNFPPLSNTMFINNDTEGFSIGIPQNQIIHGTGFNFLVSRESTTEVATGTEPQLL